MSRALVGRFRARWLHGALPMVIVHRPGLPETICAAPSLWMGGKLVAERLRDAGIGAGHRVRYAGPVGPAFVQALVGVLRASATFLTDDLDAEGLPPHALVREDLVVEASAFETARGPASTRALFRTPEIARPGAGIAVTALDDAALESLADAGVHALTAGAGDAAARCEQGEPLRVGCLGQWNDGRVFAVEVLGGLLAEAELHLGVSDVPSAQLEAIGSVPHLRVVAAASPEAPHGFALSLRTVERGVHQEASARASCRA
jgi:hypothetical protein